MTGDFSKSKFGTAYSGSLRMQQGRPLLDSDWNEQAARLEARINQMALSLVGASGVPDHNAGFEITPIFGVSLNSDPKSNPECLGLRAAEDLPFTSLQGPALPFNLVVGFTLNRKREGTVLHIPGLVRLEVTREARLRLVEDDRGPKPPASTGKTVLHQGQSCLLMLSFDGQTYTLSLRHGRSVETEISLVTKRGPQARECPFALSLGAQQGDDQSGLRDPLPASFWYTLLVGDVEWIIEAFDHYGVLIEVNSTPEFLLLWDFKAEEFAHIPDATGRGHVGEIVPDRGRFEPEIIDALIGAGALFINGQVIHNPRPVLVSHQPHVKPAELPLFPQGTGRHRALARFTRFNLVHWQQTVTALQDPGIHDPALGPVDTTAEVRNRWRVTWITASNEHEARTAAKTEKQRDVGLRLRSKGHGVPAFDNGLLRVQVHDSGWPEAWPIPDGCAHDILSVVDFARSDGWVEVPATSAPLRIGRPLLVFRAPADEIGHPELENATRIGSVTVSEVQASEDRIRLFLKFKLPKLPDGEALYLLPIASFKWSTNNACQAARVIKVRPRPGEQTFTLTLESPGYNGLDLHSGSVIELSQADPGSDYSSTGMLFTVDRYLPDRLEVDISVRDGVPSAFSADGQEDWSGFLTRWESQGALNILTDWQHLWNAVDIQFKSNIPLESGDFWTAPIRTALPAGVEWPGITSHQPTFEPRQGPYQSKIALLDVELLGTKHRIIDKRHRFSPAIETQRPTFNPETMAKLEKLAKVWSDFDPEDLKAARPALDHLARELLRPMLDDVCKGQLHLLGSNTDAGPAPLLNPSDLQVDARTSGHSPWRQSGRMPSGMLGAGECVWLGGRPVFIRRDDNSVWGGSRDPSRWRLLTRLDDQRNGYTLACNGEAVYFVGGVHHHSQRAHPVHDMLRLDAYGHVEHLTGMHHPTIRPVAAFLGKRLFVAGGRELSGEPVSRMQYLEIDGSHVSVHTHKWELPTPVSDATSIVHKGVWLVFGGYTERRGSGLSTPEVQQFDRLERSWRTLCPMPVGLKGGAAWSLGDQILLAGGQTEPGHATDRSLLYDPARDVWAPAGDLSTERADFGLAVHTEAGRCELIAVGGTAYNQDPAQKLDRLTLQDALPLYR